MQWQTLGKQTGALAVPMPPFSPCSRPTELTSPLPPATHPHPHPPLVPSPCFYYDWKLLSHSDQVEFLSPPCTMPCGLSAPPGGQPVCERDSGLRSARLEPTDRTTRDRSRLKTILRHEVLSIAGNTWSAATARPASSHAPWAFLQVKESSSQQQLDLSAQPPCLYLWTSQPPSELARIGWRTFLDSSNCKNILNTALIFHIIL